MNGAPRASQVRVGRRAAGRPGRRRVVRGCVIVSVALLVELLIVPRLLGVHASLRALDRVDLAWLIVAVSLEAVSLACYAALAKSLFVGPPAPASTLNEVVLATTAVSHLVPAGPAVGMGLGFRMLTATGVPGAEVAAVLGIQAFLSAVILNVLLWVALVCSIPLAGLHPGYVAIALISAIAILVVGGLVVLAARTPGNVVKTVSGRFPAVPAERVERLLHGVSATFARLCADRRARRRAVAWAAANWLTDAACLWCVVAALGVTTDPVLLFAA